jgi:hypothetical protein
MLPVTGFGGAGGNVSGMFGGGMGGMGATNGAGNGGWWNDWGDTANRLFVPFGAGADNSKAPLWDIGGQFQHSFDVDMNSVPPVGLPYFQEDRDRLGGMLDGKSPYAGSEWGSLISQLQDRASGKGPSVAGDAYKQASQDSMNQLSSMSQNSSNPAAVRQAQLQAGHINQGMAQGYAGARNQEMLGAQNQLSSALGTRDAMNQNAYMGILGKQLGLSQDQLKANMSNQQYAYLMQQLRLQGQASQYQAVSGMGAGIAKMYGAG